MDNIEKHRVEIGAHLAEIRQTVKPPEILSFLELINKNFPEIPWDVHGIFESGTINMISAPPNTYKSWVVQHIAISLALGSDVFGHFKTKKQNVLIVNEEDNLRMLKDRSLKMVEEATDLGIYFMVGSGFKITSDTTRDILHEAQKRKATFVVFDSLRSIHNANENDSQEMQTIMDLFKELTREGVTVLFTHHNRKRDRTGKSDATGEESRGSTAINAAVHGHISCEEVYSEEGKSLIISQRKLKCDEKLKPFSIRIEVDKQNNKMNFPYIGDYDAKEAAFRKNKELVLRMVQNNETWQSKKDLSSSAGVNESTLSKILQELEKEKLILVKSKKDLEKENIKINAPDAKHNAKFYFKKEVYQEEPTTGPIPELEF